MKTLILYKSRTGFARKYAGWLQSALNCDMAEWTKGQSPALEAYDHLIYGAGLYAGSINGLRSFLQKAEPLGKKITIFATGSNPVETEEARQSIRRNLTEQQRRQIRTFYLPGGLCYEKMGWISRMMMAAFCAMMKKKEGAASPVYQQLLKSYDAANPEHLSELISCCRES